MVVGKDGNSALIAGEEKSFDKLVTAAELEEFMQQMCYNHDIYFHYTKAYTLRKIHEGKSFYLSSPIDKNDKKESDLVIEMMDDLSCYKIPFLLCFSSPIDKIDNISMWYLYTKGQGIALKMDALRIKELVNSKQISLVEADSSEILKESIEKNIEIKIRDVVYYHNGSERLELRWHGISNYKMPKLEFEKYEKKNIFFCKDMVWNAEEEVRIVGFVDHDLVDKFKDKKCAVSLNLPESFFNGCNVVKGPEFSDDDAYIKKEFPNMTISSASGNINVPFWKQ